jgi:hypothetical protein
MVKKVIGFRDISYVCLKCQKDHRVESSIGVRHKKYSLGIDGSGGKLVYEGQEYDKPFYPLTLNKKR